MKSNSICIIIKYLFRYMVRRWYSGKIFDENDQKSFNNPETLLTTRRCSQMKLVFSHINSNLGNRIFSFFFIYFLFQIHYIVFYTKGRIISPDINPRTVF